VRERRDVGGVVGDGEHARVLARERVAASVGGGAGRVDVEQAGDGLLLEPLLGVAGSDARALRELGAAERTVVGECAVEAELGAEVDRVELERADGAAKRRSASASARSGP
jgi:hypothetical protein